MYDLPYYKEKDQKVVFDFIHSHPFAFLCGCSIDNTPVATQVPVFIEDRNGRLFLSGHMMRQTDHHKTFEQNPDVLCVFSGAHTYVSASWYSDPHQASTWNYMAVHVKGKLKFLDKDGLISILRKTTLHFENKNEQSPTVFDNLADNYTQRLMRAIIAFDIEVIEMNHVFKLSQDRDEESYNNIIIKLEQQGGDSAVIAREMKDRQAKQFQVGSDASGIKS